MEELTERQIKDAKIAYYEGVIKKLKTELDDLKGEAKDELMELNQSAGIDRRAIKIGEEKVGEIGISYSTDKPVIVPSMEREAIEYLRELGLTYELPVKGWEKYFTEYGSEVAHKETGDIVKWATWQGILPKYAAIRGCKPEEVIQALRRALGDGYEQKLLGGING